MFKSKNYQKTSQSKKMVSLLDFFTSDARLAFTELRQAFIKVIILYRFDLECYIRIEMDTLGYEINKVFSQLTSDNLGQ